MFDMDSALLIVQMWEGMLTRAVFLVLYQCRSLERTLTEHLRATPRNEMRLQERTRQEESLLFLPMYQVWAALQLPVRLRQRLREPVRGFDHLLREARDIPQAMRRQPVLRHVAGESTQHRRA